MSWDVSTTDASWCTVYVSGNNLAITTSSTTQNRQAVVTITGGKEPIKINVYQTKWATGDQNGDAIVLLNDDKSFIHKSLSNSYAWSTQEIVTGAISKDDGVANTNKIHSIPNWQSLYPAFAAIEKLNTAGESGWYMPAINELNLIRGYYYSYDYKWSSTEGNSASAYEIQKNSTYLSSKTSIRLVIAAKRFDAYKIE